MNAVTVQEEKRTRSGVSSIRASSMVGVDVVRQWSESRRIVIWKVVVVGAIHERPLP